MATLVRSVFVKIVSPTQGSKIAACTFIQNRSISGRALREAGPPRPPKPAPFDYVNKDYTYFRSLFDRTTHRFDENSKVIVVEGPVAAGKSMFASCLADDLGMKHFCEPNMNYHYILPNGFNLRSIDHEVPEAARTYDHVNFNCDPCHPHAGAFQIMMYEARYAQYVDALAHVMNTGQGVVLERSPFSDFVFLEAMYARNYISKGVRSVYYDIRQNTIEELMRPHLVIYLDLPVDKVRECIKNRGCQYETTGTALTPEYLTEMERQYKDKYLRDISTHAELLVYDWTGGGEVEVVVEDIERLNFEQYVEREEAKMKDWRLPREMEWADKRQLYTNQKYFLLNLFNVARADVPELVISAEDEFEKQQVYAKYPEIAFMEGYNEGNTLFKNNIPKYSTCY